MKKRTLKWYEMAYAKACDALDAVQTELRTLKEALTDRDDDYKKIMNEQCAPDEKHCSCVPHLKKRIAEYQKELLESKACISCGGRFVDTLSQMHPIETNRCKGCVQLECTLKNNEELEDEVETLKVELRRCKIMLQHLI